VGKKWGTWWEQERRKPAGPTMALLKVVSEHSEAVAAALI